MSIDIKSIDIDMYAFSGHKMLGPTGIGVLYIKNPEQYEPLMLGGELLAMLLIGCLGS